MKIKHCNYCGHKVELEDNNCPNCGDQSFTIREDDAGKVLIYEKALKQIAEGADSPHIIASNALGYIF